MKKTSGVVISGVFLVGLALSAGSATVWGRECPELSAAESVRVARVHDGDTLRLQDGRRVRLIAVNAPELARENKPAQPLARASRAAVEAFIAEAGFVHLSFESRRADRYGRVLAHVTLPSGRNLESHLVRTGLAFPLAVPPDLRLAECLQAQAQEARREQRGVWQTPYWQPLPATRLDSERPGYRVVCGRLEKVDRQGDIYLELAGDLVLRIAEADQSYFGSWPFPLSELEEQLGRSLEVRGWLVDRRDNAALMQQGFKPWLMQVRTAFAITWDRPCQP